MSERSAKCWWLADGGKVGSTVTSMANTLLDTYGRKLRRNMHAYRAVYLNRPALDSDGIRVEGNSKYNVTQGGVDSLHAKLCLSRPRPKIVPGSRRFKAKRRAKTLQRWIDGLWRISDTERLVDEMTHDSEIYGAGVIKVLAKNGRIVHERRHPGDILTDPNEERRHAVRSLFEIGNMDREQLAWSGWVTGSKMRDRILEVKAAPEQDFDWHDSGVLTDQVKVIEAWRLPPVEGQKGRHVVVVGDIVLLDEPWEWDCFPFAVMVWGRDPERTFQGQGIVERGYEVQKMLSHHTKVIDEAFERFVPKVALHEASGVDPTVVNQEVAQVIRWNGPPHAVPTVLSPGPISPDFLGYSAELASRWYGVTGISQMDARSEADPNLESGKAKLIQGDLNSGRFYVQGKARERAVTRLAELSIKYADELYESGDDEERDSSPLDVPAGRDSWREVIPYGEAQMSGDGDEAYEVDVFPVSSLSHSIAGRMEEINQLVEGGYITDPDTARELLDMPLLDEFQDLASARREAAEREIDKCLDGEKGVPSGYWGPDGLAHALERASSELALASIDDAPREVLDMLRAFIGATERLVTPQPDPSLQPVPDAASPMPAGPQPMDPMAAA